MDFSCILYMNYEPIYRLSHWFVCVFSVFSLKLHSIKCYHSSVSQSIIHDPKLCHVERKGFVLKYSWKSGLTKLNRFLYCKITQTYYYVYLHFKSPRVGNFVQFLKILFDLSNLSSVSLTEFPQKSLTHFIRKCWYKTKVSWIISV